MVRWVKFPGIGNISNTSKGFDVPRKKPKLSRVCGKVIQSGWGIIQSVSKDIGFEKNVREQDVGCIKCGG